jgi:hypothetical protein
MTLSLAIIFNVIADLTLIGGLAYVMSHATRLGKHVGAADTPVLETVQISPRRPSRNARRSSSAWAPVTP